MSRSTIKGAVFGPLRKLEKELKRLRTMPAKGEDPVKWIEYLERYRAWRNRNEKKGT